MYSENGGRLMRYEYKKFDDDGEREVEVANPMEVEDGLATFVNLPADMDFTVRIRAGSDRMAVTDRDVDAYDLTDADNRVVGAFGEGQSGARPDVWLCPQTDVTPADGAKEFKARCSTFGYQWTTGSLKVTVKNLRKDVKATVALEPDTDTHSEGDEKELKGNAKRDDKSHTFTGIQDGVYSVTLAGDGVGSAKAETRKFYHDEDPDDPDEYDGVEANEVSFDATSLRAEIRGLVANNRIGRNNTLSGDEAGEGVTLTLHETDEDDDGETIIGDPVEDSDGNAVTALTNGDGEYVFENLEEGDEYYVKVTDCPDCEAYNSVDAKTHDFMTYKLTEAMVYDDDAENTPPKWNHEATSTGDVISAGGGGGFVNFAMVYTDGELSGAVTEPFDDVDRHRVELARCLTVEFSVDDDQTQDEDESGVLLGCDDYDETYEDAETTDDDGEWSAGDLREGIYEVTVNPRGSFAVFVLEPAENVGDPDVQSSVAEHTQYVTLDSGSGSAEDADDVQIVNTNLGDGIMLESVRITIGDVNFDHTAGGSAIDEDVDYIVETVDVAPVAEDESSTFEITLGDQEKAVGEDGVATLELEAGEDNDIMVVVVAENGYAMSEAESVAVIMRMAAQTGVAVASVGATYTDLADDASNTTEQTVTQDAISDGIFAVDIPATAVDSKDFTLTVTLGTDSDWAKVEYRVGSSGDYTEIAIDDDADDDADGRSTRVSGDIDLPAEGKSMDIQVRVTAQDGDTRNPYTVRVSQAAASS